MEPRGARSGLIGARFEPLSFTFAQTKRPDEFFLQIREVDFVPVDSPSTVHFAPRVSPAAKLEVTGTIVAETAKSPATMSLNAFALIVCFMLSPYSRVLW